MEGDTNERIRRCSIEGIERWIRTRSVSHVFDARALGSIKTLFAVTARNLRRTVAAPLIEPSGEIRVSRGGLERAIIMTH